MPRRKFDVFSLSFLDCICCGFGAVILLFVLMNARAGQIRNEKVQDLRGEVRLVEIEIENLLRERVLARNALDEIDEALTQTQGLSREVISLLETEREELARHENDTLALLEHVNQLQTDLESLEEGRKRLEAAAVAEEPGDAMRAFAGDGRRQLLSGLQLRSERTLVLVDVSASMLADTVIEVLRIRNLPPGEQRQAPKWVQTQRTVEWLLARLPAEGQFHIALFSDEARPLLPPRDWWPAADPALREALAQAIQNTLPRSGSSLHLAFDYANSLSPLPDNIILLTDSLPTLERSPPALRRTVTGRRRLDLFNDAVRLRPPNVPINTLLFPMEGDPMAAIAYWRLCVDTLGSFVTVAEDWP